MISKFVERSEGTLILDRGAWVLEDVYSLWNIAENDGVTYRCTLGHVAAAANEPGVGASWDTYWILWGPAVSNRALTIILDGGGVVLTTGVKGGFEAPFAMKLTCGKIASLDGTSGSLQVDLWKDTYTNFPPTSADNIKSFNLVNDVKSSQDVSPNITLNAGDWVLYNIDSVTNIKIAALSLLLGAV